MNNTNIAKKYIMFSSWCTCGIIQEVRHALLSHPCECECQLELIKFMCILVSDVR